uniref:Replication protein n=1 Tax=Selenomonas ruminantium TaxID=971 RepID=Q06586_SELRU|nr:replication protein [Selenomonas ruminantium]
MRMTILQENEQDCKLEIIEGTGEVLEDLSGTGRKRPWSERKSESVELLNLFEMARKIDESVISQTRLQALKDCGSWLTFAQQADGTRRLANANFCRLRLCPLCGWRRSLKLFSQVSKISEAILAEKKARFVFVTLTVENVKGEELRATIKRMNEGFKCLVQDKKGMAASATFRANLMGYMKAIEVTYNTKRNDFHPHIHCIFELAPKYFRGKEGGYLTHEDWRVMWRSVMKLDYEPQVDVRAIKNHHGKSRGGSCKVSC